MSSLVAVDDDLWLLDGPVVSFHGFSFPTRMAVVRLADRSLWLWSPVRLDENVHRAVAGLGRPRYVVEPNKLHHLSLGDWVAAWPELQLYAPPGLHEKRPDLRFTAELTAEPPAAWRGQIDQVAVDGSFALTEVLFFHRRSRTCLVGDLVQRHDVGSMTWWQRWIAVAGGVVGANGSTPREWRLTFVRRRLAREARATALAWAPRRLVVAHGACALEDGAAVLEQALRWM